NAEGPRHRLGIEVRADAEPGLTDTTEHLRLHGSLGHASETDEAIGHPGDMGASALDAHVGGGTLEQLGGDLGRALADFAGGASDRRASVGPDPASPPPPAHTTERT